MGAVARFKNTKIYMVLSEALGALNSMVNSVDEIDEGNVGAAIRATIKESPEEAKALENFGKIAELTEKDLTEKADKLGISSKDADGYNNLEDKITGDIKAEVSEEQAKAQVKDKVKDKEQRTRVDE